MAHVTDIATALVAKDKLDMLAGRGKHSGGDNICRGDAIFAASIISDYGMGIDALQRKVDRMLKDHPPRLNHRTASLLTKFEAAVTDLTFIGTVDPAEGIEIEKRYHDLKLKLVRLLADLGEEA